MKIVVHIQINCSAHADKIILKYWKSCKPLSYFTKVISPGFWQQVQNSYNAEQLFAEQLN